MSDNTKKGALQALQPYGELVDREMQRALDQEPQLLLYDMVRYFLGFTDEKGEKVSSYGGKRFRSGLCLMLADFFGAKEKALEVAVSIELFHNFTLIHDDIEDHDEVRRGRPTVWKIWGINHGINTGDAQLTLAQSELLKSAATYPEEGIHVAEFLMQQYRAVIEGQFLDFSLADVMLDDPFVTRARCEEMIIKKTSVLVGGATKAAGMIARRPPSECAALWNYGVELGHAYQLYDDMTSVWGGAEAEGTQYNDIVEKKKTQIILTLRDSLPPERRAELTALYTGASPMSEGDVRAVVAWLEKTHAYEHAWQDVSKHAKNAKDAAQELSISDAQKQILREIVDGLLVPLKK